MTQQRTPELLEFRPEQLTVDEAVVLAVQRLINPALYPHYQNYQVLKTEYVTDHRLHSSEYWEKFLPDGTLLTVFPGTSFLFLLLDAEHPAESGFMIPTLFTGGPGHMTPGPVWYFGNHETNVRLKAREPVDLSAIHTPEDLAASALASRVYGRQEAAHGYGIINQQGCYIRKGQIMPLFDDVRLHSLIERIVPQLNYTVVTVSTDVEDLQLVSKTDII